MPPAAVDVWNTLKRHWPEYLIEAAALGTFMVSATLFTALFEFMGSPVHRAIENAGIRRAMIGLAMGLTAIALIYSRLGRRSGAHMNPCTTLTFLRLGKIKPWDAVFYVLAQFGGAIAAMVMVTAVPSAHAGDPAVNYVVTVPGTSGQALAFVAELGMAFGMMSVVLWSSNHARLAPFTGVFAGLLVAIYITCFGPVSGMSINPARSLASAVASGNFHSLWIYFAAPLAGVLFAAETFVRVNRFGLAGVLCAKLCHNGHERCIFRCGYCAHSGASSPDPSRTVQP